MKNNTSFYRAAFGDEQTSIWGFTKFQNEIENLCYRNALSAFIRDNEIAELERRQLLYSYLSSQFSTANDNDSLNLNFPILPTDNTYVKRVLRNLCVVYNLPPTRTVEGQNGDVVLDIINKSKLNNTMLKIHRIAKLTNEVAVRLKFVSNQPKLEYLTPDLFRYEVDNYGKMTELWIYKPIATETKNDYVEQPGTMWTREVRFHKWTAEEFKVVDYKGNTLMSFPNVYGEIPYTILKMDDNTSSRQEIYGGSLWELIKAQLDANKLTYLVDNNLVYTGFAMWVAVNFNLKENDINIGPGQVLKVDGVYGSEHYPIPPYMDSISASAQYQEIEDLKVQKMKNTLKNLELPPSLIDDGAGVQSGISMLIDRKGLDEIRREDISVLKAFEDEFIAQMVRIANIDLASPYRGKFNGTYTYEVDYADMETPVEPAVEYELLKQKFNDGLISVEYYVRQITENENITDEKQAIEYLKHNKENLRLINDTGTTQQSTAATEELSATDATTNDDSTVA